MRATWKRPTLLFVFLAAAVAAPVPLGAQEEDEQADEERVEEHELEGEMPARAMRLARALRAHGPRLGVQIEDVDEEDVEALDLPAERGAKVVGVLDDTPAAEVGLREGDVIVRWNEEPVESVAELTRLVRETPVGREVALTVVRDGGERQFEVRLEERGWRGLRVAPRGGAWRFDGSELSEERLEELRERMQEVRERVGPRLERLQRRLDGMDVEVEGFGPGAFMVHVGHGRMGVRLQSLTDQLADYFGVESGALVAAVSDGSPADGAGLRAGDVIVEVDGREADDPRDVARAVRRAPAGPLPVTVARDGERRTLTVELPAREEDEGSGEPEEGTDGPSARAAPAAPPAPPTPGPADAGTPPTPPVPATPPAPGAPLLFV